MARLSRVVIPGCPHHIIQRGNRRSKVFFSDSDKAFYLALLTRQTRKSGIFVWAFCLMDNHVHLIAVPEDKDSFTKGIGATHRMYTNVINIREGWRGYLWQGRFISYPLDEVRAVGAVRYVERNPVRAGMVERADAYPWSSAWAHVNKQNHPLLTACPLESAIPDWSGFLGQKESQEDIKRIHYHERTGRPLGSQDFVRSLEELTGRVLMPMRRGRKSSKSKGE